MFFRHSSISVTLVSERLNRRNEYGDNRYFVLTLLFVNYSNNVQGVVQLLHFMKYTIIVTIVN